MIRGIRKAALLAASAALFPALSAHAAGAPFSDDFAADTTLAPGWTYSGQNTGDSYNFTTGGLQLVGAGNGSDLWPTTNYGGALMLQGVSASANYQVTTEFAFTPTNFFQGVGMVLTTQTSGFDSSSQFLRFEAVDQSYGTGFGIYNNGTFYNQANATLGADTWLRIAKIGTSYTFSYSTDGTSWNVLQQVTDATNYTYIGLDSLRQPYDGQTSVVTAPIFSDFQVSGVPEPAPMTLLLAGAAVLFGLRRRTKR